MSSIHISQNEELARVELSRQSRALALLHPLFKLKNMRFSGVDEETTSFDVAGAVMWLFDKMLYYQSRIECPGTTREEAERLLVEHISESYPSWKKEHQLKLAKQFFSAITPREGFSPIYYDFESKQHKKYFFRLLDMDEFKPIGLIYNLTKEGSLLYSTRLEDQGLEKATVAAIRASRTLRRGEIDLAVEFAEQTAAGLDHFRINIDAGIRAARIGDTSFTFEERMIPLLDQSYDLLEEISDQVNETLKKIHEIYDTAEASQRMKLFEAEEVFRKIKTEILYFRNHIRPVPKNFIEHRMEIIAQREVLQMKHDLKESLLVPLLNSPISHLINNTKGIISLLLPPVLKLKSKRVEPFSFDLETMQLIYESWFESAEDVKIVPIDQESESYIEPAPLMEPEIIDFANQLVTSQLNEIGTISFNDVIERFQNEDLSVKQCNACLLTIGSLAAAGKDVHVTLNGKISFEQWHGDNLGIVQIKNDKSHLEE